MHRVWGIARLSLVLMVGMHAGMSSAAQYKAESSVLSNVQYNDNVFLTDSDRTSSTSFMVFPQFDLSIEEANWNTDLEFHVRATKYSVDELDNAEQHYKASARYEEEKDVYSIDVRYDVTSSLNTESSDFGLVRTQVDRDTFSLSPRYTFYLTPRTSFSVAYTFSDVEYEETVSSGFVPYQTHVPSFSVLYLVSERTQVNFVLAYTDYNRDDGEPGFETIVSQLVYNYRFTENITGNFSVGFSKRDVTQSTTGLPVFFLGTEIRQVVEDENVTRGAVYGIDLTQKIYNGEIIYNARKDDQVSSFGSLDEVYDVGVSLRKRMSDLWSYSLSTSYTEVNNIGFGTVFSSRTTLNFRGYLRYSLRRNLHMTGSYLYASREFDSQTSDSRPDSNSIYLGLQYSFDDITSY